MRRGHFPTTYLPVERVSIGGPTWEGCSDTSDNTPVRTHAAGYGVPREVAGQVGRGSGATFNANIELLPTSEPASNKLVAIVF